MREVRMVEIDVTSATDYALREGLFPRSADLEVEWLSGGVSNVVLRLTDRNSGAEIILKQAREKLRVQADWRSRLDRVWREVLVLKAIAAAFEPGTVPRVLFEDRENYLFAMTAVPRGHAVWKNELLAGRLQKGLPARLGTFLARVHSTDREILPAELHDQQVFDELRLDPYYRWTGVRVPEAADVLEGLVSEAQSRREGLVLADFSPKNILLWNDRVTVIDFETAHLGDPAFDLGFFLTHLVLKTLHVLPLREELQAGIREFWEAYRAELRADADAVERRSMGHLAACLLARVDGKSPVDYLTETEQDSVRRFAIDGLNAPASHWSEFEDRLRHSLLNTTN